MNLIHKYMRASSLKCRTVDVCDIFGDGSGVALYRLDGNANDESGNYHGTETAITYGGGVYERGAVFNKTSSLILTSSYATISNPFTYSAYVKVTTIGTGSQNVIDFTTGIGLLSASGNNSSSSAVSYYDNAGIWRTFGYTMSIDVYTHLCLIVNGTNADLYVNGVYNSSSAVNSGSISGVMYMGRSSSGATGWFGGSIDQVRIFNRAITATEVQTLYAECEPTSIVDNINPFMDGSLKALYQFNGDATDKTGVYNGTATNVTYGTGKFGQCAVFNGSSSFVNSAISSTIFSSWTSGFSISMMVSFASATATYGLFNENVFGNSAIEITKVNGGIQSRMYLTGSTTAIFTMIGAFVPRINTFYHLVCLWDGKVGTNNVKMYIDGTLVRQTSAAYSISSIAPFSGIYIGRRSDGYYLNGSIDQVRIFNKALTPMEVAALYNETTPLEEPMSALVDPFKDFSGKALYRLDGNALDESGNHNGTATNVTYGIGKFGRCAVFNGTSSKVALLQSLNTVLPTTSAPSRQLSISMWIKFNSFVAYSGLFTFQYQTYIDMSMDINGNRLLCGVEDSTGDGSSYILSSVLSTGIWYHVVLTYNGTNTNTLYLNGTSIGTGTTNGTVYNGAAGTLPYIGARANDTRFTNGSIDQVRIFNRALTSAEVSTLYTEI